jgi:hypothetical protein
MERHREKLFSSGSIEKLRVINHAKDLERFKYIWMKTASENIESMALKVKENSFRRIFITTNLNIRKYNFVHSVPL